ncbi:MAG: integrase core domain-containing protein, partial [Lactovum sp.]
HSDKGTQYTSKRFRKKLDQLNILASYSQPGYPYDNSVTEAFFKYFKLHCANSTSFSSTEEVRLACFQYIDKFYNDYRPHQANQQLTPNQKETHFFQNKNLI